MVTGELERRWEAALLELRRAEEALAQRKVPKANDPIGVAHDLRAKVIGRASLAMGSGQSPAGHGPAHSA